MNIELSSQQHYNTCLKEAYPIQIYFLHKAHHSLCALRTVSSALCLLGVGGVRFKQKNRQQKVQKYEKCGFKETLKRTLIYRMRLETRKETISCSTSVGIVYVRDSSF